MAAFVATVAGLLALFAVSQLVLGIVFARALTRPAPQLLADEDCPRAAVVLCLRGTDPFLENCILAILALDYPDFDIRIVIDREDDPAWEVVERVLGSEERSHVHIEPLTRRGRTCSLKCSSVVQAIEGLDESHGFVAQLDADTIPHRTWLRELATALQPETVGAATGNRWYFPVDGSWGGMVRYIWNAAAVVQMYLYGIAWGGTLAIKTSVLHQAGLLDRWRNAFCEDTMLTAALRPLNLRVAFVPSLMMINREDCSVQRCDHWIRRQLLTARLYHPLWPAVAGHGFVTSGCLLLGAILAIIAGLQGNWLLAGVAALGVVTYEAAMLTGLGLMERAVRKVAQRRGEPTDWMKLGGLVRCLTAVPLTQALYVRSLAAAMVLKTVDWRGVKYRVDGPWEIHMLEDQGERQPTLNPGESL